MLPGKVRWSKQTSHGQVWHLSLRLIHWNLAQKPPKHTAAFVGMMKDARRAKQVDDQDTHPYRIQKKYLISISLMCWQSPQSSAFSFNWWRGLILRWVSLKWVRLGWFTQGVESPGNWRIGCQLLLPALACNRNWLRSSVFLCVCVCSQTDWAISPGTAEPRCSSIKNTMSVYKHGGTDRQMERDWYQRAHLLSTCPIRSQHTDYKCITCKHTNTHKAKKAKNTHIFFKSLIL